MRVTLSEGPALRRLSASLATSLAGRVSEDAPDLSQSAAVFFRLFPWSGRLAARAPLPKFDVATAGQYFRDFNWDGTPPRRLQDEDTDRSALPTSANRRSAEQFLKNLFEEGL